MAEGISTDAVIDEENRQLPVADSESIVTGTDNASTFVIGSTTEKPEQQVGGPAACNSTELKLSTEVSQSMFDNILWSW